MTFVRFAEVLSGIYERSNLKSVHYTMSINDNISMAHVGVGLNYIDRPSPGVNSSSFLIKSVDCVELDASD